MNVLECGVSAFLYDPDIAQQRIESEGCLYRVNSVSDIMLSPQDFLNAREMHSKEAAIVFDEGGNLADNRLFRGMVYCFLTQMQDYATQVRVFDSLLSENLVSPENVLSNKERFEEILVKINYHDEKARYVYKLAESWDGPQIYSDILAGVGKGKEKEVLLRKEFVKDILGFKEKTASLFLRMCGAEYLIPIDTIMAGVLYLHGYPVEIKRFKADRKDEGKKHKKRKVSISGGNYSTFESFAFDLAEKYSVPGYLLHLAFWTKKSTASKFFKNNL